MMLQIRFYFRALNICLVCAQFLVGTVSVYGYYGSYSDTISRPLPIDDRVRIGHLDNGLVYYIHANNKPEDRAELRLVVSVGSINEDEDQLGLAHFVEHMAFNGTTHFEKNELIEYLQSVGTRFGPDLNAYTSFDETVYQLQVRTDSTALFEKGMLILEDWAGGVSFDHTEIDKERGVVISELRTGLGAMERMRNQYLPVIFKDSRYAERLPIGNREVLEGASYDVIKRFYRDWYRPDLMAVVVVGDVDVDQVEMMIRSRFSKLSNPENPKPRVRYGFPSHDETLVSICQDEEARMTLARVMYKHPAKKVATVADYRNSLTRNLFNRMLNNRLDELRQQADPPFLYAYSGYGREVGDLDSYTIYASTADGDVLQGLGAAIQENLRVLQYGFTQGEFERAKSDMISEAETTAKESDKYQSATLAQRYVYHFLQEDPILSPEQRLELAVELLPAIDISESNDLAKLWIVPENRVIVLLGPSKEGVAFPSEKETIHFIEKVESLKVVPYEDKVIDRPLLDEPLNGGDVVEEIESETTGVVEWTLSNGVKVVLKETDFQNDEIVFTAFSPGGHSQYDHDEYWSASWSSAIINQSGLSEFSRIDLEKMLAGKIVQVSPFISEEEEGLQGLSTVKDLETMFQLIYLYFTAPRKDESVYRSFMTRQKQILQNLLLDPGYYFLDRATSVKYNDHPRRGFPNDEDLESISLDEVMEVYQDRFADGSDFTFVFVGNFTIESIRPLITKYIGSLPNLDRTENWKDVGANYVTGRVQEQFKYGKAPKAQVDITYHGHMDWDVRKNRLAFSALLEVLRNKFRESMREEKGGVYGVRVSGSLEKIPKEQFFINISFNAEPEQVNDLIQTAWSDIEIVFSEGPEPDELQRVIETKKQSRLKDLKENSFWMNALRETFRYGLDPENILLENYEMEIRDIGLNEIREMAEYCFSIGNYIEIVMMPGE